MSVFNDFGFPPMPPGTILARLLTVDGSGSGLDADLLDGLNSSDFASSTMSVGGDLSGSLPNPNVDKVAGVTPSAFILTLLDDANAAAAQTTLGLGSLATQAASSVAITGGAIDGTAIGATTAAAGKFSSVTNTGLTSGRVPFATTGGLLTDSANLTWNGTTFTVTGGISGSTGLSIGPSASAVSTGVFNLSRSANPVFQFQTSGVSEAQIRLSATKTISVGDTSGSAHLSVDTTATTGGVTITGNSVGLTIAKTSGTTLTVSSTDDSSSSTTGAVKLSGGLGVAKKAFFGDVVVGPAATTGGASFRLPHGTAPTSPTNGDLWTTTAGVYAQINGATVGPLSAASVSLTNANAGSLVIGAPVYASAAGSVDKAKADSSSTMRAIGLVADTSIASSAAGNVRVNGVLTATTGQWDAVAGTTGGLTAGAIYYVSAATAGLLTATAPSTVGQYVQEVGIALSTTQLKIQVSIPILL